MEEKAARRRPLCWLRGTGENTALLLQLLGGSCRNGSRVLLALSGEVVAVPEVLVEGAGEFCGAGAEGGPSALEKENRHQTALRRIGIRGEPAEAGALVRAGAGLTEDGQFVEVGAQAAGGSVLDRAGHAVLDVGKVTANVQGPLYLGLKSRNLIRGCGVLQVVERSAV